MKNNHVFQLNAYPDLTAEELSLTFTDLTGRQLRADRPGGMADGPDAYSTDVTGVQPGICPVTAFYAAMKAMTGVIISG